jgi:hypothetical protein
MAKLVTIPKNFAKEGDLVVLPRTEYEEYLRLKQLFRLVKPTKAEKKAIRSGLREIKIGKRYSLQELKNELGG